MNNLERLLKVLPDDIDCCLIYNDINRFYLTNFMSSAGILVITRQKSYMLIDFRYYEKAYSFVKDFDVILLTDEVAQIKEILNRHKCKNIAIESKKISIYKYLKFKENYNNFNFLIDSRLNDILENLRAIKTQDELFKISASQAITELAFEHILSFISEGKTEREIALELNNFILKRADSLAFDTIVASGPNSASPHATPTDRHLQDGDFVILDFGAKLNGYNSDMTRTICIGEPTDEQLVVYKNVLFVQNMALDYLKEGQKTNEVDKLVREYFESQKFHNAFGHSLGHGVGLEIHEIPTLSPTFNNTLKNGMVVTIEPGLYFPGKFGVRIEDMVYIDKAGCKNLTKATKDIISL